ncbi:MAG: DNA topoisomerase, partial [Nanobdellota archaeon]
IYPTGALAKVEGKRFKVYDLIVRRFMATFGEPAKRQTVKIDVNCNDEHFFAKGTRTLEPGWHLYYGPYLKIDEQEMPACKKGDGVINEKIKLHAKETQPPKRYTQASIIKELEKRNLGTKATRASVVDTLYQRKYIREKKIEVTDLGIKTIDTLKKYSPSILDEELTKHFEDEMEEIRNRKKKPQEVIEEAKKVLRDILDKFKKHEKDIGNELISAYRETQQEENTMGGCPHCKGNLVIKKGKFGRFVACDNYPDCKATFKIPQQGMIKSLDKSCQECGYPMVSIMRKGKKPQRLCINPECPAKKTEKPEKIDKKCPKCGSELKLRKSIYGQFIGCSNYPKCKYTEQTGSETGKEE